MVQSGFVWGVGYSSRALLFACCVHCTSNQYLDTLDSWLCTKVQMRCEGRYRGEGVAVVQGLAR